METILINRSKGPLRDKRAFYQWGTALALVTIAYNLVEGAVSVFFGIEDGTVSLFGFGVDSFVEVISGIGIWHMIRRMRLNGDKTDDRFERTALKITGASFYLLTAGLLITATVNAFSGYRPETTQWGIIVSVISILSMLLLIHYKTKVGRLYNSQALLADAACTKTCIYLSVVLLLSSIGYELTGVALLDPVGAAGIAVLSFREGREAYEKARGDLLSCGCQGKCRPQGQT